MDWLKVEKVTPDKPEMLKAASDCRVSQGDAFLAWFRLWCWFDATTGDGTVQHVQAEQLDRIAGVPGFAASMSESGWLELSEGGVMVMRWDRHNGKSAKQRALHAGRMQSYRAKPGKDNGFRPW